MPRSLRHDVYFHDQFRANDYDDVRLREVEQERCGLCWDLWPKSMMRDNDDTRRCPDCYEEREIYRINEIIQHDNERIATRQMRPQISLAPLRDYTPPYISSMTDVNGVRVWAGAPMGIVRDGIVVGDGTHLLIIGGDFLATDEFSYSSGVGAATQTLTGSTQWDLALHADEGMTPGLWHVTFNSHTYRNILSVR